MLSDMIKKLILIDSKKEWNRLSSFALRFLALISMIIDHAGLALFPDIWLFRCIGRLSFPIY